MVSSGKIVIEKFNGQSFELWKLKMEDLVITKSLLRAATKQDFM